MLLAKLFLGFITVKNLCIFLIIIFIHMTTFESFKKTLTELFDWSSKPQSPNVPKGNLQGIGENNDSKSAKHTPDQSAKNEVHNKTPESYIQNQRTTFSPINPMIHYIKTILIEQEVECPICLTKYKKPGMVRIGQCGHEYCPSCLRQYVNQRLKAFEILKCPDQACNNQFSKQSVFFKSLTMKQKNLASKIEKFHYTSSDPYLRMCPTQNCEGIIPVIQGQGLKCPVCHKQFCKKCMYLKHSGKCTNNQVTYLNAKYRYRKCGRCGIIVQKTQACNHITCKCGYEFCYGCGRRWPGNGHHCNPTRVNRQSSNQNRQSSEGNPQSIIIKVFRIIGQIILTMILICGVAFYGGACLLPMMLCTLVCGVIFGVFIYSFKFIYDTCKKESPGLGFLLILVFPVAIGFGIYNAFESFWWDGFLFWWEILRQAIQKPLGFIWNV